ncbi:MAG: ClC family H(+)/Cl(-) exchange transporter [Syntrophaceticus sp.]|nr:ClC family H(+)/Cl(-) exchange transporter [Syntrophaceticus sp.]HBG23194.1 ClC family H(+)/Cl(-) exchange transporter [Peptococcaceae bacterium]
MNNYKAVVSNKAIIFTLFKSILVGLLAGIVVVFYRSVLMWTEGLSFQLFAYVKNNLVLLPIALVILIGIGLLIGFLVSKFPMISGSGIPQVKGILMGHFKQSWLSTLLAKFFGGATSILAGFSLGREGPSIQLGACVAEGVGNKFANSRTEKKILIVSGASAGLAAAFNAPLAGAMFALEEIIKYFSPILLLSIMVSAVVADFVSTIVFGFSPVFDFVISDAIPLHGYWLLFILGITLGAGGAFYNFVLVNTQKLYKRAKWLNTYTRPIVPAIFALIISFFFPLVLGSGQQIIPELQPASSITFLCLLLLFKFILSMISFGSGAPGGIFFPLLVMGSIIGAIFGNVAINFLGFDQSLFFNFVIIAMAGFFTAIVRAPITGIILLIEMTGSFANLLSLTFVSIVTYITATLLKSKPIYDTLLRNMIYENTSTEDEDDENLKITLEVVVQHGSLITDKFVKEIDLPSYCLLILIKREGSDIIPRGDTKILAGDNLILMTNLNREVITRELLNEMTTFTSYKQ